MYSIYEISFICLFCWMRKFFLMDHLVTIYFWITLGIFIIASYYWRIFNTCMEILTHPVYLKPTLTLSQIILSYIMYTHKRPLLTAFSVYSNGKKLFRVSKQSGEFTAVHGIRFLSMMWVIFGHTFFTTIYGPVSNSADILKFLSKKESLIIGNAPYAVDTFFVVTGMLVVYSFMKTIRQRKQFNIIKFYLHRYIRLTPPIIPVILSSIYLTQHLSSGPFYPQLDSSLARPCRNSWWATLLLVQNYVSDLNENLCIGQTWYLNIDWQMYLISPLFLLWLPKYPKIGLGIMLVGLTGSMIAGYLVTWNNELLAVQTNLFRSILKFNKNYYLKTHTRVHTWLIGGFLGYILAKIKLENHTMHLRLPKWIIGVGWLVVLAAIPTCVFAGYDTLVSYEYHPYSNAFYNTFARPAWGLCICWIIFACAIGYGGTINTVLSLSMFQVLNRFTYSVYLLHLSLLYIVSYSQKQPGYFSMFNVAYNTVSAFALSFAISIFWVLAFESPIVVLEKYLLRESGGQTKLKITDGDAATTKV